MFFNVLLLHDFCMINLVKDPYFFAFLLNWVAIRLPNLFAIVN